MKLGFYDSGLGGISVLREFVSRYQNNFSYVYFGDSARAPYGSKTEAELLVFIKEILDYMQEKQVDIVISACNTTSMLINKVDLSPYSFKTINLFEVMKDFFDNDDLGNSLKLTQEPVALMATNANIDSGKYKDWAMNIYPVKCPSIVPLVEAGNIEDAYNEWEKYLSTLPTGIKNVIVGCTHYEFLVDESERLNFISPAKLALEYFKKKFPDLVKSSSASAELDLDIYFSKDQERFLDFAQEWISMRHPQT